MASQEINAKTLIRIYKRVDSWFLSKAAMNLYRGCQHNCTYCDGRSEKYQVKGVFGEDVAVKTNAIEILQKELKKPRIHKLLQQGYLMVGGGVGDSYQPIEGSYQLTRKTLNFLKDKNIPLHLLTKSTLIRRALDIIKKIQDQAPVIVSMSFSSTDDTISSHFEPDVPPPSERLQLLHDFKKAGIPIGIFLLPAIPFITDTKEIMEQSIRDAKKIGVDFLLFGGMTLKEDRQKEYFLRSLLDHRPDLAVEYEHIYQKDQWGNAIPAYYQSINETFDLLASAYKIPKRIPPQLFIGILSENDRVSVILEHLDYLLKLKAKRSSYGFAAYAISKIDKPLSEMKQSLQTISGIGPVTEKIIQEIITTKTSTYYEQLLPS
jgi:DNA repair photolyase